MTLNQFEPFWSNLNNFEAVWTIWNHFEPIWSSLNHFESVWSILKQFEPFWISSSESKQNTHPLTSSHFLEKVKHMQTTSKIFHQPSSMNLGMFWHTKLSFAFYNFTFVFVCWQCFTFIWDWPKSYKRTLVSSRMKLSIAGAKQYSALSSVSLFQLKSCCFCTHIKLAANSNRTKNWLRTSFYGFGVLSSL